MDMLTSWSTAVEKPLQVDSADTKNSPGSDEWPSRKLDITVYDVSSYKDDYRPENVLVNDPANQNSRWSVDYGSRQQYIVFKLRRPAILDRMFFGKFEKVHTSSLRRFRVLMGLRISAMTEVITGELNHRNVNGETFPVPMMYKNQSTAVKKLEHADSDAAYLLPTLFIRLEPLATPVLSADYCSLWYVEMHGVDDERIVSPAIQRLTDYQQVESCRLMLKFFRQMRLQEPYEVLSRNTGITLEASELTELHALLVDESKYEEAEKIVRQAALNGLFDDYVNDQSYKCQWEELKPGGDNMQVSVVEKKTKPSWPVPRGGHAMCVDVNHRRVYVFGGWDGKQDLADLWAYNFDTNTWKCLSSDTVADGGPCARSCHRMVIDSRNQTIYVTGRFVDARTIGGHQSEHENIIPSLPMGHGNGSALVGGRNDFYSYNVERNEWHQISACTAVSNGPRLLFDHAMCIDEESGVIYVFGGNIVQFRRTIDAYQVKTGRLSGMYAYRIEDNKWHCLQRDACDMLLNQAAITTNTTTTTAVGSSSGVGSLSVATADTAATASTSGPSAGGGSSRSDVGSSSSTAAASSSDNNLQRPAQDLIFHIVLEPADSSSSSNSNADAISSNNAAAGGAGSGGSQQQQLELAAVNSADQHQQNLMQIVDELYDGDNHQHANEDEQDESNLEAIQHILNLQHEINNNMLNEEADDDDDDDEDEHGEADDDDAGNGDDDDDDNSTVKDDDDEDHDSDMPPPLSPLDGDQSLSPASLTCSTSGCSSSTATNMMYASKHSIPLRVGHCMLFHPKRKVLYIFGGRHGAYDLNDFITYDPARHECVSWVSSASFAPNSSTNSSGVRGTGLMQRAVLDAERDEIYVHFGLGRDTATHICIANNTNSSTHAPPSGVAAAAPATTTAASVRNNLPLPYLSLLGPVRPSFDSMRRNGHGSNTPNETGSSSSNSGSTSKPHAAPHQQQRAQQINMNNSLWLFKIGTGEWSCFFSADAKRCGNGSEPCARYAHQVAYDSMTRQMYMFGGNPSYAEQRSKRLNDLWRTSLVRYSRDDVVRKCVFRIRVLQYLSLLRRAQKSQQIGSVPAVKTFDVLSYLQTKLAPCVAAPATYVGSNTDMTEGGKKRGFTELDADDHNDDDRRKLHALANMLFNSAVNQQYPEECADQFSGKNEAENRDDRLKVFQYISTFVAESRTEPREDICDFIRLQV